MPDYILAIDNIEKYPEEIEQSEVQVRITKAKATCEKRAYLEWRDISNKEGIKNYLLVPHGVFKSHWRRSKQTYYSVSVREKNIILRYKSGPAKVDRIITFKNGKVRLFLSVNFPEKRFQGLAYHKNGIHGFFKAALAEGGGYEKGIQRAWKILEHEIYLLSKRLGVKYIKKQSFEENYIRLNYNMIYNLFKRSNIFNKLVSVSYFAKKFNRKSEKSLIKSISGENSKAITRLIYKSILEDDLRLVSRKIWACQAIKKFVTIDDLQKVFASKNICTDLDWFSGVVSEEFSSFAKMLVSRMSRQSILKFILSEQSFHITDIKRMSEIHNFEIPEKIKDLKELHDDFAARQRHIFDQQRQQYALELSERQAIQQQNYPVELDERYKDLIGLTFNGFTFDYPKTRDEFFEWGARLSNCIGGYAWMVREKSTFVLGVIFAGNLKYALEIRGKKIIQFYGSCNSLPDPIEAEIIRSKLKEYKIT